MSLAGIIIGLVISCIVSYLLAPKGWNAAAAAIVCLITGAIVFITVMLSIRKPMKIAAGASPIEALRYSGVHEPAKAASSRKLHRKLTPAGLAKINFLRNPKKAALTLLSLALSGILFICAATINNSISYENLGRANGFSYGDYILSIKSENGGDFDGYSTSRIQFNNPLNEELKKKILSIDGVTGVRSDIIAQCKYVLPNGNLENALVSGFSKGQEEQVGKMLKSGRCDYGAMSAEDGVIIMAAKNLKLLYKWEPAAGEKIQIEFLTPKGAVKKQFKVFGVMDSVFGGGSVFLMTDKTIGDTTLADCTGRFSIAVDKSKKEHVESALKAIVSSSPPLSMDTLDDTIESLKSQLGAAFLIIYAILLAVAFFGVINLINTTAANILSRKHEFAMLQAIGLSRGQLVKMLSAEGLFYTAITVALTCTAGPGLGFLLCKIFHDKFSATFISFRYPLPAALFLAASLLAIQTFIFCFSANRLKKEPIVERLLKTE